MLRLDRLRAFLAFAETGSFTRAAEQLALSQPALHAQIGQLGDDLGAPLYRRVGRRIELTAEGEQLAGFARELDDRTDRFLDAFHGRGERAPVGLCAGEASLRFLLGPALQRYLADPLAPLRLLVGDAAQTADAVASGRSHLGFTVPGSVPAGVVVEAVCEVGAVVAIPTGHPLASAQTLGPSALAGQSLVVPPPGRPHRARLDAVLAGVDWSVGAEVQGWELAVQLVSLGMGLAVVNDFVPMPPEVVAVPFTGLAPVRYALLRRRYAPRVPSVEKLVQCIREASCAA